MLKANKEQYFSILADACLKIDGTDTVGKTLQEWLKEYLGFVEILFDFCKNFLKIYFYFYFYL